MVGGGEEGGYLGKVPGVVDGGRWVGIRRVLGGRHSGGVGGRWGYGGGYLGKVPGG